MWECCLVSRLFLLTMKDDLVNKVNFLGLACTYNPQNILLHIHSENAWIPEKIGKFYCKSHNLFLFLGVGLTNLTSSFTRPFLARRRTLAEHETSLLKKM